eukprot:scaffold79926_cov23-Tisochrysis_lutea.AAC.1
MLCPCVPQILRERMDNTPGVNMSWKDLTPIVHNVLKATAMRKDDSNRCGCCQTIRWEVSTCFYLRHTREKQRKEDCKPKGFLDRVKDPNLASQLGQHQRRSIPGPLV